MKDGDDDDDNAEARECGSESAGIQGAVRQSLWETERDIFVCAGGRGCLFH